MTLESETIEGSRGCENVGVSGRPSAGQDDGVDDVGQGLDPMIERTWSARQLVEVDRQATHPAFSMAMTQGDEAALSVPPRSLDSLKGTL